MTRAKRTTAASLLAAAVLGGAGVAVALVISGEAAAVDDQTIFCSQFVPQMESSSPYKKWATQNPSERDKWLAFRTALCAAQSPASPVLATLFGKALVAAGEMALPETPPPTTTTTTTQPTTTTTTTTEPPPTTTTPPPSTLTPSEFQALAVANATISDAVVTGSVSLSKTNVTLQRLTIQGTIDFNPGATGSKLLNSSASGFYIFGADNITLEGNTLDGKGVVSQNLIWDRPAGSTPDGFVIRNNILRNYYDAASSATHSEAIFVGYSTNGLIEGNTFTNNGNTAHIFFSWWGETANPATSYPRNICVRGNTFNATHGAFFDVNLREEIPVSSGIRVQTDASITNAAFSGAC